MFRFKLSSLCIAVVVAAGFFGVARWAVTNPEPAALWRYHLLPVLLPVLIALACAYVAHEASLRLIILGLFIFFIGIVSWLVIVEFLNVL